MEKDIVLDTKLGFEEYSKQFKEKFDIDISLEIYNQINADETRARGKQQEAKDLNLAGNASCKEESNAKCVECSGGLSHIEHMLYGNRCMFCQDEEIIIVGLIKFIIGCFYDWLIYQELIRIRASKGEEGRLFLLGCLGAIGYIDINQVKTVKTKAALIKELRGIK